MTNYIQQALDAVSAELPGLEEGQAQPYALLVLTKGADTTLADVHDAWGIWCPDPNHPCLVPFDRLPPSQWGSDQPYLEGVHRVARQLAATGPVTREAVS